jgi:hypothetical protein
LRSITVLSKIGRPSFAALAINLCSLDLMSNGKYNAVRFSGRRNISLL